jgi:spore germination protein GerM
MQKKETPEEKAYREVVEKIAGNISTLARAVNALLKGPLKRKALVVLLASSARLPQTTVDQVLKALEDLEGDWLNKK